MKKLRLILSTTLLVVDIPAVILFLVMTIAEKHESWIIGLVITGSIFVGSLCFIIQSAREFKEEGKEEIRKTFSWKYSVTDPSTPGYEKYWNKYSVYFDMLRHDACQRLLDKFPDILSTTGCEINVINEGEYLSFTTSTVLVKEAEGKKYFQVFSIMYQKVKNGFNYVEIVPRSEIH